MPGTALIVVDMQNDFVNINGALSVPGGLALINEINYIMPQYKTVVFTQDWHPADHCSFKEQGGPWPMHCVAGSEGAELALDLRSDLCNVVIHKGLSKHADSYSAFKDDNGIVTGLHGYLNGRGVRQVYICGVAYEYCVNFTAKDAVNFGFEVTVLDPVCKGITPDGIAKAVYDMANMGITFKGLHDDS